MKTRNGTGYERAAAPSTRRKRVEEAHVEMDAIGTSTLETTTGASPPSELSSLSPLGSNAPLRNTSTERNDGDHLPNEGSVRADSETSDSSTASRTSDNVARAHVGPNEEPSDRSRNEADVASTDHSRQAADVASGGPKSSGMQLVSEEDETPNELQDASPSNDGFEVVIRSTRNSRSPSPRVNSPVASEPRYFQQWFNDIGNPSENEREIERPTAPSRRWADDMDNESLGSVPSNRREPVGRSNSPTVGDNLEMSFNDFVDEIMQGLSPNAREIILNRAEKLKNVRVLTNRTTTVSSRASEIENVPVAGPSKQNANTRQKETMDNTEPRRFTAQKVAR